jgi:signal transduction histidine kinase/CheY-like chemotaxis protein
MAQNTSSASSTVTTVSWTEELHGFLAQLRKEALHGSLFVIIAAIVILLSTTSLLWVEGRSQYMAFSLFALTLTIWFLSRWNYLAAGWLLVIGVLGFILMLLLTVHLGIMIFLLFLPVGFAFLIISRLTGLLLAVGCSILILYTSTWGLDINVELQIVALMGIWCTLGLLWITLRPLRTSMGWAWQGYEHSQVLLEQTRDNQLKLNETLADLTRANIQLTRLNQRAHALRQMAEDERRIKERFVANVSHELRTPLNMIIGFSEMITQAPETYGRDIPPTLLADLRIVLRNSQHLASLIDDVLDLSQIETGQMALSKERVALNEIIEAAVIAVQPLFVSKNLYLKTEIPVDLPMVYCDRIRIREVILNLLTNAGRFTDVGGVTISTWQEKQQVMVCVTDTGPGIAEEAKERLFKPFSQLDGQIRQRYGGSGLGLAISKQFVNMHDGDLWLESTLGKGAAFLFNIPIDVVPPLTKGALSYINPEWEFLQPTRPTRAPEPVVRAKLVVVERGEGMRRLFTRYLNEMEIIPFDDIELAFKEVVEASATAVLVNDNNTEEVLRYIGELDQYPQGVPVIVCSIPDATQGFGERGQTAYLVKPVSREQMLNAIAGLGDDVQTILLVDDEPDILRLFGRMLEQSGRGYRVLRALNGHQALAILKQEHIDVLILDLIMPDMNGFQLLALKNIDANLADIPTILISARDPMAQPIVSNVLSVTCRDGLNTQQILTCIKTLTNVLSTHGESVDLTLTAAPRD